MKLIGAKGCINSEIKHTVHFYITPKMLGLVLIQFVIFLSSPTLTLQTIDIQSYLDSLDNALLNITNLGEYEKPKAANSYYNAKQQFISMIGDGNSNEIEETVLDTWGIPDQTAIAGRLFKFALPEKMSTNDDVGSTFEVTEIESGQLPDWVFFDEITNELLGIPSESHIGKQHFLEINSKKSENSPSADETQQPLQQPKDVFSIKIIQDSVYGINNAKTVAQEQEQQQLLSLKNSSNVSTTSIKTDLTSDNKAERIKCSPGSSVTKATVIVDVDIKHLIPKEMVKMIDNLGKHLNMPPELLRMIPVGNKPMFDNSALVAGLGDKKEAESPGTLLQWEVGCGNVETYHMPILQQVESTSGDGTMSQALGRGILGWHVTNNRPVPKIHRLKRSVNSASSHYKNVNNRHSRAARGNDLYEEEGSGFWSPDAGKSDVTTPRPTKTRKPHRTRTRKPRPTKTNGRHHHKTRHPKPTEMMPTTPIIVPSRTQTVVPTIGPGEKTTPSLPDVTPTFMASTPALPKDKSTMLEINTKPLRPTKKHLPPTKYPSTTIMAKIPEDIFNFPPKVVQELKHIEIQVGDILNFTVPTGTFHDDEDGNTRRLKLYMLTVDQYSLPNNSWVQFNNITQTIVGIPMPKHIGTYVYVLMAVDKNNQIARVNFEIRVTRRPPQGKINHEFSIKLDMNFVRFAEDVYQRLDVVTKISKVYGDEDASMITVTRVERGSVDFLWTNNSVTTKGCPVDEIKMLLHRIVNKNDTLNSDFVKGMAPYKVLGAGVFPKGICEETWLTSTPPDPNAIFPTKAKVIPGGDLDEDIAIETREQSHDDKFVTTIIPVVVITTMLLLAIIIACCLYRKNRKGKLSDEDQGTFVSKGIPVIFADELDDKPDPPSKPLILSEEKPPLPPPEYPRSNSGGSVPSSPGSGHREPLLDDERYTRPPPVSGGMGGGSMGRRLPTTPNQPQQRLPPPYTSIPP